VPLLAGAVDVARRVAGKDDDPALVTPLWALADLLAKLGYHAAARDAAHRATTLISAHLPPESPGARLGKLRFGLLLLRTGDRDAGAREFERLLETSRSAGEVPDETAGEAAALLISLGVLRRETNGVDYPMASDSAGPRVRAFVLRATGLALLSKGELPGARSTLAEALALIDGSPEPDRLRAACLDDLAKTEARLGAFDNAEALRARAREEYQRADGHDPAGVLRVDANRGTAVMRSGALRKAREIYEAALSRSDDLLCDEHPVRALLWAGLAAIDAKLGSSESHSWRQKAVAAARVWDASAVELEPERLVDRLEALDFLVLPDAIRPAGTPLTASIESRPAQVPAVAQSIESRPAQVPAVAQGISLETSPGARRGRRWPVVVAVALALVAISAGVFRFRPRDPQNNVGDADVLATRAELRRHSGDAARAVQDYTSAIAMKPSDPLLYSGRALAWLDLGDAPSALADVREAQKLGGPSVAQQLRPLAGDILSKMNQFQGALAEYDAIPPSDPIRTSALLKSARLRWQIGRKLDAVRDYQTLRESKGVLPQDVEEVKLRTALAFREMPPAEEGGTENGRAALAAAIQALVAGVHEDRGDNRGKEIDDYNTLARVRLGSRWAATFVSWCLHKASPKLLKPTAVPAKILDQFKSKGWLQRWGAGAMAAPGDLFFFFDPTGALSSVGIVHHVRADRAYVIEGNSSEDGAKPCKYESERGVATCFDRVAGIVQPIVADQSFAKIPNGSSVSASDDRK
jgi:tetratricopeptide (TPR) repeat protein